MSLETYGRYQLLKKLATGGMAQIYLARQLGPEGFEKLLVVKRILPHLAENDEFITMFLDEARIAARLNHPNVVQIFDLGAQDDSFFIAMEFIHGEDVRRVWKHADKVGKPVPVPLICRIIIESCAGLDYAHKKLDAGGRPLNIVHRDISPQNILVSFEGGVKIVDFGIAKAADQATVTKSGVLKGKYSYMSPEQAAGQPIDCRTDIFALGVVLYELLTGTRLFKRATDIQTLNAVTECNVALPSAVNDRIPQDLDAIVMKALAKDRTQRYGEAKQLGAALEGWLLANGQSASTAALADFMRDIYAERLAREAEEGRLLVETAEASRGEEAAADREKATPSFDSMKRPTRSMRSTQSAARPRRDAEPTAAGPGRSGPQSRKSVERLLAAQPLPARPVPNPGPRDAPTHTEQSMPTQSTAAVPGRPMLALAATVALLAAAAGVGLWVLRGPEKAGLRIDTIPSGATLTLDGAPPCTTPCELNELEPGPTSITVRKEGFQPLTQPVTLTSGQTIAVPPLALVPVTKPVVEPPPQLPAVVLASVSIESDPPGAEVTLNGEPAGPAPVRRDFAVDRELEVRLALPGYLPVTERFTVRDGDGPHRFALKAEKKGPGIVRPPVVRNPPPPVEPRPPPAVGKGTVRFIVKPWADVDCREAGIKDTTPFADKLVPAGKYSCTFSNPEYPTQVKQVLVQTNEMTKVQVNFLQ